MQQLLDKGYNSDLQSMNGIGYRQTVEWLQIENRKSKTKIEDRSYDLDLIHSITLASVQYAHRQRTWFRRYKKDSLNNPKDNVFYMEIELS